MKSQELLNSEAWLGVIKERPDVPDLSAQDIVGMQDYVAEMFEWNFSVSLASQGLTSEKSTSEKIIQNLAR